MFSPNWGRFFYILFDLAENSKLNFANSIFKDFQIGSGLAMFAEILDHIWRDPTSVLLFDGELKQISSGVGFEFRKRVGRWKFGVSNKHRIDWQRHLWGQVVAMVSCSLFWGRAKC